MAAALDMEVVDPEVVAVEARRHLEDTAPARAVVPIGTRLAPRPTPTLADYDALLAGAGR